ncbi:hypothetical protein ACFYUR_19015 [Micromonospora haikouensis]|uniref:hypothetical protein n=1 Tax=Micromonospora haikouensis TaxID=686309 RepID=UPI0036BDB97E
MVAFFTTTDVLTAITAGHNTVDTLADHFGVTPASYNLRASLAQLANEGSIAVVGADANGTKTFTAIADGAQIVEEP